VSGSYVTFELVLNPDLPLHSLEDLRAGVQLVALRKTAFPNGTATVFVPDGKLKIFERKLHDYLDPQKTTKGGSRKGTPLFNSIQGIRRTVLQDLWTDAIDSFPEGTEPLWWEVWLRAGMSAGVFRALAGRLGQNVGPQELRFPDRTVVLARATVDQMILSVDLLDAIAELRSARGLVFEFLELERRDGERERVSRLRDRIAPPAPGSPAVCVLDTGVDVGHPLLALALRPEKALAYNRSWGADDHLGHGTEMAGLALFGAELDRLLLSDDEQVQLRHEVESVKILPRSGRNDPELYGEITLSAAALIEINDPLTPRVFSISVTDEKCPEGRPTSWSAAVDQLAAGSEENREYRRLVFVSAGNVDTDASGYSYPESNQTDCIQDPAQAWNALTIGGFTEKTLIQEVEARAWQTVAPAGDLSPCSTTALAWSSEWANKPDLVLEAGNCAWDPATSSPVKLESLSLLTTRRRMGTRLTAWSGDTSAATSTAARLGALVLAEYPDLWPETVRALLVHSARWTPAMERRFRGQSGRSRARNLLRCYGYGVPDLDRSLFSLRHHLTLVVQDVIQPFVVDDSREAKSQMHLHSLPWPIRVLESLGELPLRMRVTLSYFIEPKPGQRGTSRRHRYASFGLRFAVRTGTEGDAGFLRRINKVFREAEGKGGPSDTEDWALGRERDRGSLHSDVWTGDAAKLANKSSLAVFPVVGWWRDARGLDLSEHQVRYALAVSIESDATQTEVEGVTIPIDLLSEIVTKIGVPVEILG
jgi:Subtilase family